ncbi:MAG: hypothetical protein V9E83_01620 [Baekduia sp.]
MPSVQPNRLVPGRHGHASAAAASAYAARGAVAKADLRLVPPPATHGEGVREARRHRRSVVSQDAASYQCGCGSVFTAPVSTTVSCPACGGDQAW